MPKKKPAHKVPFDEVVHFRPGRHLGGLIADAANKWQLSRGETVKRLVTLAIRGLTIDTYCQINDLAEYTTCDFGQACELAHAEVRIAIQEQGGAGQAELTADQRIAVVERLLQRYRQLQSMPEEEETVPRQKIQQLRE